MSIVRVNHYQLDCDTCGFHTTRIFGDNQGLVDVEKVLDREHMAYAYRCPMIGVLHPEKVAA